MLMLEKHYSHLKAVQAIEHFRGVEGRKLLEYSGVIGEIYKATK